MGVVTKVDEEAVVPPMDDLRRARLAVALDLPGLVAASLVGSQATGRAGPLSDIDVAVWVDPALCAPARHELELALAAAAAAALGTDEIDLLVLNAASPLVQHRAMRDRVQLVQRDPVARVRLEARAILDYLDTQPLRDELARGLRNRLAEDRFGRR